MRSFNQYYFILFLCFFNIFYAQDKIELELFLFDDIAYFSTEEFCLSKNHSCNKYTDKSKIELLVENNKFIFSINSSFVKTNDKIHQMITRVKLIDVFVGGDLDKNGFDVTINFRVINIPEPVTIELFLERLR